MMLDWNHYRQQLMKDIAELSALATRQHRTMPAVRSSGTESDQ